MHTAFMRACAGRSKGGAADNILREILNIGRQARDWRQQRRIVKQGRARICPHSPHLWLEVRQRLALAQFGGAKLQGPQGLFCIPRRVHPTRR
ncbi:Transposase [Phaeobacter inhibens]